MKNIAIFCLLFACISASAQNILLGENAYVEFLHHDTIKIELYNLYTFSVLKKDKIRVEKMQYAYNKATKGLVVIKSSIVVNESDVPENICEFTFKSDDILVKAYRKPTHCFLLLMNKAYTHFGIALR
ncbi:MAG: hypothetical protein KBC12_01990 [Candidatus Pacebacteria bacterium]|nr:hypothetical protein [Candidatus Paceibacterota bacterium]MBP9851192.1 hypothetical protein [Candidatus Paceibacterota bacterium]